MTTGVECLHPLVQEAVIKSYKKLFPPGPKGDTVYDIDRLEDMELTLPEQQKIYNIGTSSITARTMNYLLQNVYWINVCLLVNADFRSCFDDAIMIEKALMQVDDIQYRDFRDDMTLPVSDDDLSNTKSFGVNFGSYRGSVEGLVLSQFQKAWDRFIDSGMTDAYQALLDEVPRNRDMGPAFLNIIHAIVYVVNAMNRNGVFDKYVRLVVESVKKQLGEE